MLCIVGVACVVDVAHCLVARDVSVVHVVAARERITSRSAWRLFLESLNILCLEESP